MLFYDAIVLRVLVSAVRYLMQGVVLNQAINGQTATDGDKIIAGRVIA